MYRQGIISGAFFAGLAVILGAFGAHALKAVLTAQQLATYETGVKYQFYHSLALLVAGLIYGFKPARGVKLSVTFFIIGILLFSGSLYAMTALQANGQVGLGGLGILTPIGGLFFILGWLFLMIGAAKR